eukprot:gb/GECG01002508.1/.p1 GENE.gb/GECG01002508.1/~~gb/GECG01002508.1/.p1  ORF type:complete len:130 (+),score=20.56 gb/GECG01002508.1/:1-390(+)
MKISIRGPIPEMADTDVPAVPNEDGETEVLAEIEIEAEVESEKDPETIAITFAEETRRIVTLSTEEIRSMGVADGAQRMYVREAQIEDECIMLEAKNEGRSLLVNGGARVLTSSKSVAPTGPNAIEAEA